MTVSAPLTAVAACMKNEGQFLLEWVAYHRLIGFDRVFVITNDCTDGTDALARRLQERGEVVHIDNRIAEGESPQVAGMRHLFAHPALQDIEWLLHIDADEFLNVTTGAGRVQDLIAAVGPCDAVAICWRPMGSGGLKTWTPTNLTETQVRTAPRPRLDFVLHKTLFRRARFGRAIDHMPKDPVAPDVVLRNTAGTVIDGHMLHHPTHSRYRGVKGEDLTWANADIHHYAIPAEDVFLLKNVRGDGMGRTTDKYFLGSDNWHRHDRNRAEDRSIQVHLPALRERLAALRADPEIARLEHAAQDWFADHRRRHLTPENRAAWTVTQAATTPEPRP